MAETFVPHLLFRNFSIPCFAILSEPQKYWLNLFIITKNNARPVEKHILFSNRYANTKTKHASFVCLKSKLPQNNATINKVHSNKQSIKSFMKYQKQNKRGSSLLTSIDLYFVYLHVCNE